MGMYEVKKVKDRAALVDTYRECFRARFGRAPVININTANEVFSWALGELGFDDTERFVKSYLTLEDNWLENQGFPIEQFKRSLNRLIAKAGAVEINHSTSFSRGVKIKVIFLCDVQTCEKPFLLTCHGDELSQRHVCEKCK